MTISKAEMKIRFKEIEKLYEASEAEMQLVLQYMRIFQMMGHSKKLTLRILRIVTAILEITVDEKEENDGD